MAEAPPTRTHPKRRLFLTGLLTMVPLWITWLVVAFLFGTLSAIGAPLVHWLSGFVGPRVPAWESLISNPVVQAIVSVVVVLLVIYDRLPTEGEGGQQGAPTRSPQ